MSVVCGVESLMYEIRKYWAVMVVSSVNPFAVRDVTGVTVFETG
jgi:hypothetical protein